jgi:hypothetical protein
MTPRPAKLATAFAAYLTQAGGPQSLRTHISEATSWPGLRIRLMVHQTERAKDGTHS